ncbi:hypothetical protein D3C79_657130 [compost metagenome]
MAESGPVIDDAQPWRAATNKGQHLTALIVQSLDGHPMGEQGAGGIELFATEHIVITLTADPRLKVQGVLAATLWSGIADPPAVEHRLEQQLLLPFVGSAFEQLQHAKLVLRNLSQRRIRGTDDAKHFGDGDKGHLCAAMLAGNGNTTQTAAGELFDFCPGQLALLVAASGLTAG